MIDWTPTYLAAYADRRDPAHPRAPRWQDATGGCWGATACYMMELRSLIQGYKPRKLSMLYNAWTDGQHDNRGAGNGSSLGGAEIFGVCREELMPMPPYIGINTATSEHDLAIKDALKTPPSAEAVADALNQKIAEWDLFQRTGSWDAFKLRVEAALAAGYPLALITPEMTHVEIVMGCDSDGYIGLDSRSDNITPYHRNWDQISTIAAVVRGVTYANEVPGPPLTAPPAVPPTVVLPPVPGTGNTQMLIDSIKTKASALTLGAVTQAQIDALKADVNQLVADGVAGPPPSVAPITDANGDVFSLDAPSTANSSGALILRNGVSAANGHATVLKESGGKAYAQTSGGAWYVWTASLNWKPTSAP